MRIFVAIDACMVNDGLLALQRHLAPYKGRLSVDFHLTLKFLGQVDEKQCNHYCQLLNRIQAKPFELQIDHWGEFQKKKQVVVWVGPAPDKHLIQLQQKVDQVLQPFFEPSIHFTPHITLARLHRKAAGRAMQAKQSEVFRPLLLKVKAFYLMESISTDQGVRYQKRQCFPLE